MITPLHAAVAWGHLEATTALCEYDDLDLEIRDAQGRTAIDVALSLPYERILGVLQQKAVLQLSDPDYRPFPEV